MNLPTLDEAEPLAEWIVNKELEDLSLPTLEDIEPQTVSEAIMRQLTGGTPQNASKKLLALSG